MPGKRNGVFYRRGIPNNNPQFGLWTQFNYFYLDKTPPPPPSSIPNAPTNVTAVADNNTRLASISWTASTGNNVSSYRVTSNPGNFTAIVSGNVTTANISGLLIGITYTFTVTATNQSGTSLPSNPSNGINLLSFIATGNYTITSNGSYAYIIYFTSGNSNTLTFYEIKNNVEVLIVAGGGGGGGSGFGFGQYYGASGGGAGAVGIGTLDFDENTYNISVGAGGQGQQLILTFASNGENSTIIGGAINETANGGGYGMYTIPAINGGDGGSGGGQASATGGGQPASCGIATLGIGVLTYYGTNGGTCGRNCGGSGGGGATASGSGSLTNENVGGNGGAGIQWTVDNNYYGGGGGACGGNGIPLVGTPGVGGIGGGGAGNLTGNGISGTLNTGGGGGGSTNYLSYIAGNGGSGVVVFAFN